MTIRNFSDAFWGDPAVQKFPPLAKLLYTYSWTNEHCNPAGLYQITPSTIAFETGIAKDELPGLFDILSEKILFDYDLSILWVKNFIRRQSNSPLFFKSVAKHLSTLNCNGLIDSLLSYNKEKYNILIPYPIDTISIGYRGDTVLSIRNNNYKGGKGRGLKGEGKGEIRNNDPDKYFKGKYGHMVQW